jgi:hypothetical protein
MPDLSAPGTETQDTKPPTIPFVDSVRFLQRTGDKFSTLCVVVGGVSHMFKCPRERIFYAVESGIEALRKGEQSP